MNVLKTSLGLIFFVLFQGFSLYKPFLQIPKSHLFQNLVLGALNLALVAFLFALWPFFSTHFPQNTIDTLFPFAKLFLMIFAFDALSYVWHRANHQFSFLWCWHKLHHQESVIDTSTAYRFHPFEVMLSLIPKGLLLWILQATWQELILFETLFATSNLFQHSNFRLPKRIDRLILHFFTTPSLHRRHHSIKTKNQHTNYGTIFTIWDRLLKTYCENIDEQITAMGLETTEHTHSV